jgi:hypothetical protein
MKILPLILVVLLLVSCDNERNTNNDELREIISLLKKDMEFRQLEMENAIRTNPNQTSVVSPPKFDSTYAAYVSEINRVDSLIPKIDDRLKGYWESKDKLNDIEMQVEQVCVSRNITIILDRGPYGLVKNYHESYNFFMRDLRNRQKKNALYLRVKFLTLASEMFDLMKGSFLSMNLEKHLLYLKKEYGCKD